MLNIPRVETVTPAQCRQIKDDGTPCGVAPALVQPNGWCWWHDPENHDERRTVQARGGVIRQAQRRRAKQVRLLAEELGGLVTVADAQRRLRIISEAVGEGRLSASAGTAMISATREWLKAEDIRLRAEEIAALHAQVAELKGGKR